MLEQKRNLLDRFAEISILIYLSECAFGSSGRWLEIGPLSIRMVLFIICFFATLPAVFRKIRILAKNSQVIMTVVYAVFLVVCAFIGIFNGNNFSNVVSDITTYLSFALLPGFFAVMCDRDTIERCIKVVFFTATALAGVSVLIHFMCAIFSESFILAVCKWLNDHSMGGLALMQTGIYRIYMRSQIFLQVAFIYGCYLIFTCQGRMKIAYYLCEALLLSGCIVSYTRGFWLGLAFSAVIVLVLFYRKAAKLFKILGIAFVGFFVFVLLSWALYGKPYVCVEIVNRFDPNLIVISPADGKGDHSNGGTADGLEFDSEEKPSVDYNDPVGTENLEAAQIRVRSLRFIQEMILKNPILGSGLGCSFEGVRDGFRSEYMYYDVILKSGFLGFILFVAVYFSFLIEHLRTVIKCRKKNKESAEEVLVRDRFLVAAYLGVALTSYFNPFLSNPMGISLLMLTVTSVFETQNHFRRINK